MGLASESGWISACNSNTRTSAAGGDTEEFRVTTSERVLPLQGGRNFRDMGGYSVADGRRVKWRRLYRSGVMAALTPGDFEHLAGLGMRTVVDLRTVGERDAQPVDWSHLPDLTYWARDYDKSFGDLRALLAGEAPRPEQLREAMTVTYRTLPVEQAPAYRELFRRLAEGEVPLIFNCSAGKDRTGVAAALILSALGAHADTIMEDYLLTNEAANWRKVHADPRSLASQLSPEIAAAILGVDAAYLHAALTSIEERHGSVAGYLREALDVTDPMVERIRDHLLE
jgi:protein-tyrosine phosphatase